MLVSLKGVLKLAEDGNYAVGAFNSPTFETAKAAIEAAEELNIPVILQHAEAHFEVNSLKDIGSVLVNLAKAASVPVSVHLDHGMSLETVKEAIDIGFSSVMIDASYKEFNENIATVKEVVDYAQKHNVSVEAELGVIRSSEVGGDETTYEVSSEHGTEIYTDPLLAKEFVERTNIDALAASFGTVHGIYLEEPNLDIQRLNEIHQASGVPIVMHGGSGLSHKDYRNTINAGVRKINYFSYASQLGGEAVWEYIKNESNVFYHEITAVAKEAMKADIKRVMYLFLNK